MVSPYLQQQPRTLLDALLDRSLPFENSRAAFFQVMDYLQLAVMITDRASSRADGPRFLYVNNALCKMTGYTREALIGQTPRLFQGPRTDVVKACRFRLALQNTGTASVRLVNYGADGAEMLVDIMASRIALGTPVDDEVYLAFSQRVAAQTARTVAAA